MIRPYLDTDVPSVAALLAAVPELPATSAESFRAFAGLSFNRGARDFRVATAEGQLVGLLTSTLLLDEPVQHIRIAVHPDHRRRGLGSRLLAEAAEQAAVESAALACNTHTSWSAATGFLRRHGFTAARTELLMRHDGPLPQRVVPDGVTLRAAGAGDDSAWIALHEHGYGHLDDIASLQPADLAASRAAPGFTLTMAERAGVVVGLCHGLLLEPGLGLINSVVVHHSARGTGLGAALTAAAMAELAGSGATRCELNVHADNAAAIAVYCKLGFVEFDRMVRSIRAPRGRAGGC